MSHQTPIQHNKPTSPRSITTRAPRSSSRALGMALLLLLLLPSACYAFSATMGAYPTPPNDSELVGLRKLTMPPFYVTAELQQMFWSIHTYDVIDLAVATKTVWNATLRNETLLLDANTNASSSSSNDVTFTDFRLRIDQWPWMQSSENITGFYQPDFEIYFSGDGILPTPDQVFPALQAALENPIFGYLQMVQDISKYQRAVAAELVLARTDELQMTLAMDIETKSLQNFPTHNDLLLWELWMSCPIGIIKPTAFTFDSFVIHSNDWLAAELRQNATSLRFPNVTVTMAADVHPTNKDLSSV